jgi:hypothetical protein
MHLFGSSSSIYHNFQISKRRRIDEVIYWDLKCEPLSSTLDVLECKMQTNDDCSILMSGRASLIGLVPLWLNSLVSVSRSFQNG